MKLSKLLEKGVCEVASSSKTAQLDSEVLLAYVLGKNRSYLFAHADEEMPRRHEEKFLQLLSRRARGEPIAYLVSKKEFYSLDFFVNRDVLIPRPETEGLVDLVISYLSIFMDRRKREEMKIIDVGCGCGNIAIAIMKEILDRGLDKKLRFKFYLTDISGKALRIARRNWKKLIGRQNSVRAYFLKKDLLIIKRKTKKRN